MDFQGQSSDLDTSSVLHSEVIESILVTLLRMKGPFALEVLSILSDAVKTIQLNARQFHFLTDSHYS